MFWIVFYIAIAVVVAAAAFLITEWARDPGIPGPDRPAVYAVAAGLLWPVLVIGSAQFAAVVLVRNWLRRAARPALPPATRPATPVRARSRVMPVG